MSEAGFRLFQFYMRYLADAIVNPFPMAEEPHVLLDMNAVRFAFEAERLPVEDWPHMVDAMRALHRARWDR
jgi:hypothetical protein